MAYEKTLSGALTLQNGRPAEAFSKPRAGAVIQPNLFAAHMGAAGQHTAQQAAQHTTERITAGQSAAIAAKEGSAVAPAPGQARAQALDTLNRMLEEGDGGDAMHSLRNGLSNMALAGLTRLTQSELMGPVAESARNVGGGAVAAALSGRARFDIQNVERIRSSSRSGPTKPAEHARTTGTGQLPGSISAQFESGAEGIAAIGYDSTGGTSYGKYQIASAPGTMQDFVKFLKTEAPDLASRLEKAGPANTGGKKGGMPTAWREIAAEQPERFERLQDAFISKSHFEPAMAAVSEKTGLQPTEFSDTMKEALWSTAVQHGPSAASRIFARAFDKLGSLFSGGAENAESQTASAAKLQPQDQEKVIREVYAIRATQFGSSTKQVQDAVQQRLGRERDLLLAHAAGKQTSAA